MLEAEAIRDAVRALLAGRNDRPMLDSWMRGLDRDLSRSLGSAGWIGMTWPAPFGEGASQLARLALTEELLRVGAPVCAHWTADRQIGPSLIRYGSVKLQEEFLPRIRQGSLICGIGLSEPDAGSDLAAIRTRARRVEGGWTIDGTKVWTTSAHAADVTYLLARTGEAGGRKEGLTEFLVDMTSPGLTVRPITELSGECHFNEMIFESVFVPDDRVIGEVGNGWQQVTDTLAFERGGAERYLSSYPLLVAALDRARSLADRGLSVRLGAIAARMVALRRLNVDLAHSLDQGQVSALLAAELKLLGTLLEQDVVEAAREIAGVCGSDEELDRLLAQGITAMPAATIRGGTSEVMRSIIGRSEGPARPLRSFSPELRPVVDDVLDEAWSADAEVLRRTLTDLGWFEVGSTDEEDGGTLADLAEISAGVGRHASPVEVWPEALDAAGLEPQEDTRRRLVLRAAALFGAIDRATSMTVEHVATRHQFGKPLIAFQAVAQAVAEMATERDLAYAAIREALDRPTTGTALAARSVAAGAATRVAALAHQLHGAMGMTQEHTLHHFTGRLWAWRDADEAAVRVNQQVGDLVLAGTGDTELWSLLTGS